VSESTSEICIVGGGPAGLAAALALTQSGREVTVLDCAQPPIDKACGEGLMPDGLAALQRLGVTLPEAGMPIHGIRFRRHGALVSADFPSGVGRGLRRVLLHQTLLSKAEQKGIRLMWGIKNVHTRRGRVSYSGGHIDTKLIVGADGQNSLVRREAGLEHCLSEKRRFGFRRHYQVTPWSPYVEVYWADRFQIYVTPVAWNQVCVALVSTDPHLRLDVALPMVPELFSRLNSADPLTSEKGSLTISRRLREVAKDGYVLLGDASGSVDAITGEGLCLAFKQSAALVDALDAGDSRLYQRTHRQISATARQMASLLLMLDSSPTLQRKAMNALATHPEIFSSLLAAHVNGKPLADLFSWQLVSFGLGVLRA
jgi:2-polyprenyl-6-methoxyphenol hydroxylase-like FAD-dependent oxidoreductase